MKHYIPIIKNSKLFQGLEGGEIFSALTCLKASVKSYRDGTYIYREGDEVSNIGIILSGEIQTQKLDYTGNMSIISRLFSLDLIAAVAAYSTEKKLPFDVVATFDSEVMWLDNVSLVRTCSKSCDFHNKLVENMLHAIADKNIQLSAKIDVLSRRTLREKILSYLHSQSKKAKNGQFSLSLSRKQMAEYLSVNRSALSRELSKMRDEGVIDFDGNLFRLKRP